MHLAILLLMPPLLPGIINRTKAWFAGRRGPPLFQLYFDLFRLLRKEMVLSTTTTWIFQAGPIITLAAVLLAGVLVPLAGFDAPIQFPGDLVLFAYLFGLGRFFTTSAALDTGSSFEGMGAAREVTFACLSEPALFLGFLVLIKLSGAWSLTPMLHAPMTLALSSLPVYSLVLVAAGLFVVLLAENCRIPVDDPNTHLELTMIHEAMVLDHSGPLLGLILYGASVKLFVLSAVLLHLVIPFQSGLVPLDWALFIVEIMALAIVIGAVESVMARLQIRHVPTLLVAAILSCGLAFFLMLR
jgi:formate hydrogenlyase subunit 4